MSEQSPWMLVGLGNPGSKYAGNRHNVGFAVADAFAGSHSVPGTPWRSKWEAQVQSVRGDFGRCVVLKPQTFMNASGKAVAAAAKFHAVPPGRIVVAHDELDFAFGRIAIKDGGGHGGHNGLRDIVACTGTRDFLRLRFGIGRPPHGDVTRWVLSDFQDVDAAELPDRIDDARRAINLILTDGVRAAMNTTNQVS